MNVSASITIDCPIDEVFDFVSSVENMPAWVTGVSNARLVSTAMAEGARYVCEYTSAWRTNEVEFVVTTFDPPKLFGSESRRGLDFQGRTELAEVEGGTAVTNIIEADPDSLSTRLAMLLLGRFLRRSMQKRLARELESLRRAVGGRTADA